MHIHLPKPLHGWREFIGEVGIVFLGVLIALGAEQILEAWHWSHKRAEVQANLFTEMRDDNGVMASAVLARTMCADQVLNRMAEALDRRADRQEIAAVSRTYPIMSVTFDSQAFTVAQSSEALLHGDADDLVKWGGAYGHLPVLDRMTLREQDAVAVLQSWTSRPGQLSEAEEQRALQAMGSARSANSLARRAAASLLMTLHSRFGIAPPRQDQVNLYRKYRSQFGQCAIDAGHTDLGALRSSEVKLLNSWAS